MLDHVLHPLNEPLAAGIPRQLRLYQLLKLAILDGVLAPGALLPATRLLASHYRIARNSVLYAYQQLVAEGFLNADRGGTRVALLPVMPATASAKAQFSPPAQILSRRASALQLRCGEPILPFAPGVPDLNAFPWSSWAGHLQKAWGEVSARQLAYAAPGGEPLLRQSVAAFLRARRGVVCTTDQVFIVAGAQMALDACARVLADVGDTAWLETPCYPAARTAMQAAGLNVVNVAVDSCGMVADDALWQSQPPKLLYLTPSHQYPLGAVLSLERRLEFLRRIRPGAGWIIEDDYDSEFNHARPGQQPVPAIQGLVADAPVVYIGTFSKLLYPGLRIAYMVVPRWAAKVIGEAIESLYRSGQAVEQRALARFLESGRLTSHQRTMAPIYRQRQAVLRRELRAGFGVSAELLGGAAGLHLTLLLPDGPKDSEIIRQAEELGVTARALSEYGTPTQHLNGLVLGYGMAEEKRIPELVARLRLAYYAAIDAPHNLPAQ